MPEDGVQPDQEELGKGPGLETKGLPATLEEAKARRSWQSRFQRVTTSGRYTPEIDGLRFIAIFVVVLYHVGQMTWIDCGFCADLTGGGPGVVNHFDRGVQLFFVISGMVLGLPFANEHLLDGRKVSLKAYYLRRLTRLEPPYLINLLIRLPMIPASKHLPWAVVLPHFLASLFYVHGFVYGTLPMVHIPAWSLEVEVQFYLLAPLFAVLFLRRHKHVRWLVLIASIVGFSVLRLYTPGVQQTRAHLSLLGFIQYFLLGFLLSEWMIKALPRMRMFWIWDALAMIGLAAMFWVSDTVSYLMLPLCITAVVLGAFRGPWMNRFVRLPFVYTVGGMCYSLYLTHSMVVQGWFWVLKRAGLTEAPFWQSYVRGMIVFVPILIVGGVFFLLVEQPCMDRDWPAKLRSWIQRRNTIRIV